MSMQPLTQESDSSSANTTSESFLNTIFTTTGISTINSNNSGGSTTNSSTTNTGITQQPLVDSPTQTLSSFLPPKSTTDSNSSSIAVVTTEEEDSKRRYTNLDLLEADTPINRAKVSLKLHELEYKVDVEKKVQEGIKNLYHLLDRSSSSSSAADKRRKAELQEKQLECTEKMTLLNNAVKKYKDLYLGEDEDDVEEEEEEDKSEKEEKEQQLETRPVLRGLPGARKPITGKLQLKIVEAHELAHAPTRMFRDPHTAVMVKIDGNIQFRTRLSKNDKWTDSFEMHVDKATEVELLIYDQSGDRTLPIGLLWLKISDIAENLRKQKLEELEQNDSNWVPADEIAQQHNDTDQEIDIKKATAVVKKDKKDEANTGGNGISAWFDVEPLGRIYLEINFGKSHCNADSCH